VINIQQLCKSHGDRRILNNVNARVDAGETIAIVGPSGGGKSTLLRCLNYLDAFDSGTVEIAGHQLLPGIAANDARLRVLRQSVGMVFQQFNLFPHFSVLENITLAPMVAGSKEERQTPRQAHATAMNLLAKVGLADRATAYPNELSGGQQQRVAIARALAQSPTVMLFDEPTSALDPEMRNEVMQVVKDLAADGMTMLVVTHEMQFATDIASRIWVIDRGTIAEDGPAQQIIEQPKTSVARDYFAKLRVTAILR
jgi:ABC-type polar amino acid transport system ATPase subunit